MYLENSYLGKASKPNLWRDANGVTVSKNFGETQFGMTYHIEDGGNTELGGMSPNLLHSSWRQMRPSWMKEYRYHDQMDQSYVGLGHLSMDNVANMI